MTKKNASKKIELIAIITLIIIAILSLLPIFYVAMFDYATGDDFGKSANVHRLVVQGASIFAIIAQAAKDAVEVWKSFEGTWASNFVLALQPGIWGEKVYVLTPFIGMAFLFTGVGMFLYEIVVKKMGYAKSFFAIIYLPLLILSIQYMPFIRGGLFWFTGMGHYTIPLGAALILLSLNLRYLSNGSSKLIPIMLLLSIYMGGSHYQAILLVLILQFFFAVMEFDKQKKIKTLFVALQMVIELIGLMICAKAPGNSVRAGDEFGFSVGRAFYTVFQSIVMSAQDGAKYVMFGKLIAVYFFAVLGYTLIGGQHREKKIVPKYLIILVYSFLTYCAIYAPGVYYITFDAELGISGGFFDFNYFCLLIWIAITAIMLGEMLRIILSGKRANFCAYGLWAIAAVVLVIGSKSIIKNSADYMIYNYVKEGHLKDFEDQMQERLAILLDDSQQNVVVPEMNNDQGPFMHMPLTADSENFTNDSTRRYYGKESVIAIPRDEYYSKYGK